MEDTEVNDIEVKDHVEVIPVTEVNNEGVTRYSLDDYMEVEQSLTTAEVAEEEPVFEKKTIAAETTEVTDDKADFNPMNSSIEEGLKNRADERRRKLKEFNYKFRNNISRIDEIEKQPAYKRAGIELNDAEQDSNDDIQLRSNNSFLHDNVD